MAQDESYQSNAAETPLMRKWLLRALVISLLVHAALLFFFNWKKLESYGTNTAQVPPSPVRVRQVQISTPADEEVKTELPNKKPVPVVTIPETKPMVDEVQLSPAAPEMTTPLVPEKPKVDLSGGFDALDKNPGNSLAALENQLRGETGSFIDKSQRSVNQPKITIPINPKKGQGGVGNEGGIPGRISIEQALENVGGPIGKKAIAIHGGALFEWGKADLLPAAVLDLQKLGQLIKRNPKATFIISGHTDHTGTHETNLLLSQQRADAVRDWLVANFAIDPMRITTIGKADDDAFPELGPDKSIDEQAPNRRVEIVIKTRGK